MRDFIERLNLELNTRAIESLIKVGAFAPFGGFRSQHISYYKKIYESINKTRKNTISGQLNLFSTEAEDVQQITDTLPSIPEYDELEILKMEKEMLGIYINGHPLDKYKKILENLVSNTTLDIIKDNKDSVIIKDRQKVIMGGILLNINIKFTKRNDKMAFALLEDEFSQIDIIIFPNIFNKYIDIINEDEAVIIEGEASISEDRGSSIICSKITRLDELEERAKTLWIKLPKELDVSLKDIEQLLLNNKGFTPVIVYDEQKKAKFNLKNTHWVNINDMFLEKLKNMLNKDCIVVKK